MVYQDIQNFANENRLDVREISPWQFRLIKNSLYKLDIYIKKNKRGEVIQNTTLNFNSIMENGIKQLVKIT